VNQFVLQAAAEKILAAGHEIPGVFHPGDIDHHNDNGQHKAYEDDDLLASIVADIRAIAS
jgi:hypothetical protein